MPNQNRVRHNNQPVMLLREVIVYVLEDHKNAL